MSFLVFSRDHRNMRPVDYQVPKCASDSGTEIRGTSSFLLGVGPPFSDMGLVPSLFWNKLFFPFSQGGFSSFSQLVATSVDRRVLECVSSNSSMASGARLVMSSQILSSTRSLGERFIFH